MANTKSAAKQARSSLRKRAVNLRRKHTLKKLEKQFRDLIHAKKIEEAKALFPKVVSTQPSGILFTSFIIQTQF